MSKAVSKKPVERRKSKRKTSRKSTVSSQKRPEIAGEYLCQHCGRDLRGKERALFVEEEVGRVFCSEECIANYFGPDVERLEKEYFKRLSVNDLTGPEREKLAHLRWITLQEPDEVWREKTLAGDYRYTLISEFKPSNRPIWCVCICLFLRSEPSFLFLAFPTKNAAMVNAYRKGEQIDWEKPNAEAQAASDSDGPETEMVDGLAEDWTEDETLRAQLTKSRRPDDIPESDFGYYESCLEESLQDPSEVWSTEVTVHGENHKLYHFIHYYAPDRAPAEAGGAMWYVIIAREVEEDEQIEILDAFPTRDPEMVQNYRRGVQEISRDDESTGSTRVLH